MLTTTISCLPSEILLEIFNYIEEGYGTLFSCILVNQQWHILSIPILWRDPFYSVDSVKILVNCLLVIDKNFLLRNNINLSFKLLNKPPLYNYVKFIKNLCLGSLLSYERMIDSYVPGKINSFKKALVNFTLDY